MATIGRGRPRKVDGNHAKVCAVWRDIGAKVMDLSAVGQGCPDVAVLYRGQTYWCEIKDGSLPPSKRRRTPDQVRWHAEAHARGISVHMVHNEDEALAIITGAKP